MADPAPASTGRLAMLGAATRLSAIFGDPVEHSLSPLMHNAAYAALGLDRAYAAFRVSARSLGAAIRAITALEMLGVNVTVPHKERAVRLVARLSAEARLLGAANCVVNRAGVLYGDNTDARGLEADLRSQGLDLAGKTVIVVGAGGGAAAAALACLRMGAGRVAIVNRTSRRALRLKRRLARWKAAPHSITLHSLPELVEPDLIAEAAAVINATPMGLVSDKFVPLVYEATAKDCVFYDLVYQRAPTPFLEPALELGRPVADGAGMLLQQGALAFELFNEIAAPVEAMQEALYRALGRA